MLIIHKDIHFKHATANNVQYGSDKKPFLIIKWEEFPALIDLIGLITSADFNRLSIDLKLVISEFQPTPSPNSY